MTWAVSGAGAVERIAVPKVALSTISVYPENTATGFATAQRLGYDGVEVMVTNDPVSQSIDSLRRLRDGLGVPILAVHAPCLFWLNLQRVWGTDPWGKLVKARMVAEELGASTVVVHPPFVWQGKYANEFVAGLKRMQAETDIRFAVENMYPWRASAPLVGERRVEAYSPGWDPTEEEYPHFTLDLSHSATSRVDTMAMLGRMGSRLAHLHLADGSGSNSDEHLVPGRGRQPCSAVLGLLGRNGFEGNVVLEVNTRRAPDQQTRDADLLEALVYARRHLVLGGVGDGRETRQITV
ncbi:sugar phosphate isomerase/epimerase family protein [Actinospica robiniae]|uniref:sugar phosphate isomerase/epimerase family protein n=1 Tax=Actinospica robiniae TaxID=304901 RepID=UPI001FE0805B|nr:sugar phosphate isomerase/epimerase [Actinospica robiniae]